MYTDRNFKTKKALKEAIALGAKISLYQPGPFGGRDVLNGEFSVEGPHYPKPHSWYARVTVVEGFVTKVK